MGKDINNRKNKILYIITQSQWGGAQRYVFDLAVGFKDEFEVAVACGTGGNLIGRLEKEGIQVFRLKNIVRQISPWRDLLCFWDLYFLIRRQRPNIVHTNSSKAEILGNMAARLAGVKKIIFTAHGFAFNEDAGFLKKRIYIFWEKIANLFCDRIICVSNFDMERALENGIASREKMMVIHNGIEIREEKEIAKIEKEKIVIGSVANLYQNKGLEYLIQAAAILKDRNLGNLEFQIVGEGPKREFLETEIKKSKLDNFKLLGFKEDAKKYMENFDIFVLPSLKEGFPYAILEAMAIGLPIVATRVGGVPEAVINEENGFLVESKNPVDLAEKIGILIADQELRKKFGSRGRNLVRENFSLTKMLEETKKVLR